MRYSSIANSFAERLISRPPRETLRDAVSSVRSPAVSVALFACEYLRVMARSRASSSGKAKGFTR